MQIINNISSELNIPAEILTDAMANSRKLVKHIKLQKRNGTDRDVYQPSKKLKIIQYWLIENVFYNLNIHDAATAFMNDKSIKLNAYSHRKGKYFLKLDFKDFFPSIKYTDLKPIILKYIKEKCSPLNPEELLETIRLACFYKNDYLPVGYPSSPIISNIVMYEFDSKISEAIIDKSIYGNVVYTRYADDMTFSTDLRGACKDIEKLVKKTIKSLGSPKLQINISTFAQG